MEDVQALIMELPTLYIDVIKDYLAVIHEINISTTELYNNLCTLVLTYKLMQCTASQWDKQAYQAWCNDIATNFSQEQFTFIDESSKDGHTLYHRFGCALWGKRPIETTPLKWGEWVLAISESSNIESSCQR